MTVATRAPRSRAKAPPAADTQPAQALVRARFARAHRHAGKDYLAGDELDVDAPTFELLSQFGAVAAQQAG